MNRNIVRIIALVLAGLMLLGTLTGVITILLTGVITILLH